MRILPPKALRGVISALIFLFAAGCGTDTNPTNPGNGVDPPEEIQTPTALRLTKIVINSFPTKKGSVTWDAGISVSSRRPDVYVKLQLNSTSATPIFSSTVDDDAFSGVFTEITDGSNGTDLPRTFLSSAEIILSVMDEDNLSADDLMGRIKLDALDLYRGENESGFSRNVTDGASTVLRLTGTWIY